MYLCKMFSERTVAEGTGLPDVSSMSIMAPLQKDAATDGLLHTGKSRKTIFALCFPSRALRPDRAARAPGGTPRSRRSFAGRGSGDEQKRQDSRVQTAAVPKGRWRRVAVAPGAGPRENVRRAGKNVPGGKGETVRTAKRRPTAAPGPSWLAARAHAAGQGKGHVRHRRAGTARRGQRSAAWSGQAGMGQTGRAVRSRKRRSRAGKRP